MRFGKGEFNLFYRIVCITTCLRILCSFFRRGPNRDFDERKHDDKNESEQHEAQGLAEALLATLNYCDGSGRAFTINGEGGDIQVVVDVVGPERIHASLDVWSKKIQDFLQDVTRKSKTRLYPGWSCVRIVLLSNKIGRRRWCSYTSCTFCLVLHCFL